MNSDATPQPQAPWRRLFRRWAPRAVFEVLLIVFSIMLALAASGWIEDLRTQARVREARAFLVEEITANRERLLGDHYLPHHRRLQEGFNTVDWDEPMPLAPQGPMMATFRTGVHFAQLRDAVWQSVTTQGLIEHMPQEEVFALYDAYRAQEQLSEINRGFYPVLAQMPQQLRAEDIRGPAMSMQLYLGDVVASETSIVGRYDDALETLAD